MTTTTTTTTRRGMLAIGAVLPALVTSRALGASSSWGAAPEPILAAIEAHRAACRIYSEVLNISARLADGTPEHDAASAVTDCAEETLEEAGFDLADTEIATLAGLLALVGHITEIMEGDEYGGNWRLPDRVEFADGSEWRFERWLLCSIERTLQNLTAPGTEKIGGRA